MNRSTDRNAATNEDAGTFLRNHQGLSSRKKQPERWFRKKLQMQGAQKLRSEAHLGVRRNDEVEAQRRRWTFYKTIRDWLPEDETKIFG